MLKTCVNLRKYELERELILLENVPNTGNLTRHAVY